MPGGGWPTGARTEILSGRAGIGELQLVLPALAALSWAGKRVVWLAPPHLPYAPALAAGQRWSLALRLKRPRGTLNPGGFDFERHARDSRT